MRRMSQKPNPKNVLVAPLNWGLGHAARCIPIVRALEECGFTPILASDGAALALLQKEFPQHKSLELPSYRIEYAEKADRFKSKMLKNLPSIIKASVLERKIVGGWVSQYGLCGIISDNRFGVFSKKIPSVYLTHQLNVLSGGTTWLTGRLHRLILKKFDECWIPDIGGDANFSGKLGHLANSRLKLRYIGVLSRFEQMSLPVKYDLAIILSGPEPQRAILEEKLTSEALKFNGKVLFVKGVVETAQVKNRIKNIEFCNFMTSSELETALNQSALVLSRSGYTTIMDLAKLKKKAFFIPTPGQFEQEYLAEKLENDGFAPYAKQDFFKIGNLSYIDRYKGLPKIETAIDWKDLFKIFGPGR